MDRRPAQQLVGTNISQDKTSNMNTALYGKWRYTISNSWLPAANRPYLLGSRSIKGKGIMRTYVLRMGDYLGACKAFAKLQDHVDSASGMNQAQGGTDSSLDGLVTAGLVDIDGDTGDGALQGLDVESGIKDGAGGASVAQYSELVAGPGDHHLPSARVPRLRTRDKLFDSCKLVELVHDASEGIDIANELDASEGIDIANGLDASEGIDIANGMLSAADVAIPMDRAELSSVELSSTTSPGGFSGSYTAFGEDLEDAGALSYLARYINMPSEDIHTLRRSRATLGTLERLTGDELRMLGFNNPMGAIALLRAASALGTLRQFKAVAKTSGREIR
jgi:hypothetical protein